MMTNPALKTTLQPATLAITAEAIRTYAELTNDFNPLHLDSEFAAKTPMGRVIAHGTMSLCLLWQCIHRNFQVADIPAVQLDVRFMKPVFIGDALTAGGERIDTPAADAPHIDNVGNAPARWRVWIRGQDGSDRVAGEIRLR